MFGCWPQLAASERGTLGYKLLIGLALGAMGVFYACLWVYYQYQTCALPYSLIFDSRPL